MKTYTRSPRVVLGLDQPTGWVSDLSVVMFMLCDIISLVIKKTSDTWIMCLKFFFITKRLLFLGVPFGWVLGCVGSKKLDLRTTLRSPAETSALAWFRLSERWTWTAASYCFCVEDKSIRLRLITSSLLKTLVARRVYVQSVLSIDSSKQLSFNEAIEGMFDHCFGRQSSRSTSRISFYRTTHATHPLPTVSGSACVDS